MNTSSAAASGKEQKRTAPHRPPEIDKYVDTFLSTICDTSRRYILELLTIPDEDDMPDMPERRSGDIAKAIGLSAATTSEHLRQLTKIGLVDARKDGNIVYYRLRNRKIVKAFQGLLNALDGDYAQYIALSNHAQKKK